MRKIPTLFLRDDLNDLHHVTDHVNPAAQWVFDAAPGEVLATRKYDGTCVKFDGGASAQWWARREVRPGKAEPAGWVLVDVDEVTGKRMGWVPIDDRWQFSAMIQEALSFNQDGFVRGTYELCGPKINGNPEGLIAHALIRHADAHRLGLTSLDYDHLREALWAQPWEGVVWHHVDGRMAKLKRKDFRHP